MPAPLPLSVRRSSTGAKSAAEMSSREHGDGDERIAEDDAQDAAIEAVGTNPWRVIEFGEDHEAAGADEALVHFALELFDGGGSGDDFADGACGGAAALSAKAVEDFIEGQDGLDLDADALEVVCLSRRRWHGCGSFADLRDAKGCTFGA